MARAAKLWPALLSGLLYLAAFPPFNFAFLVFVALVPWFWSLRTASGKGAFGSGYVLGLVVVLGQMHFLQPFVMRWTASFGLSLVPWLLCGIIGAFYFALLGLLIRGCLDRGWIWAIPLLWGGMEVIRSFIPGLAFPWFILATPLWTTPALIQTAFYGTIYFVSAWVVLFNLLLLTRIDGELAKSSGPVAVVWALLLVLSVYRYQHHLELDSSGMRVAVGQPGVDMAFSDRATQFSALGARINSLIERSREAEADLLVLPEGLVFGGETPPPLTPFAVPEDLPIIFGGRRGEGPAYQTAFAFDGKWKYADKTRLVVFGEYVPGRDWIPFLSSFHLPSGDLIPGDRVQNVEVGWTRAGPLICFEALFYDVAHQQAMHGADLLTVMSIDDWYMGTPAPEQLLSGSAWRAVETGIPVVRSATLGITAAFDYKGRLLARAPVGTEELLVVRVITYNQKLAWRPLFPWVSTLSLPLVALLLGIKRRDTAIVPDHSTRLP
jgi:apolipoprotein N-acyltransferase